MSVHGPGNVAALATAGVSRLRWLAAALGEASCAVDAGAALLTFDRHLGACAADMARDAELFEQLAGKDALGSEVVEQTRLFLSAEQRIVAHVQLLVDEQLARSLSCDEGDIHGCRTLLDRLEGVFHRPSS